MLRVVLFLALLGAMVWAFFWVLDRRRQAAGPGDTGGTRPLPRAPRGPDDDEDFLRELDRKRRHDQRKPPATPPAAPPPGSASGKPDQDGTTPEGEPGAQTDENA